MIIRRLLMLTILIMTIGFLDLPARAYEINEKLSIGGVLAGAYQYQNVSGDPEAGNKGKNATLIRPEISYTPTKNDEIFMKFGFAAGNALVVLLSFDQRLGERLGAWIRFGWGDDKAAVDFSNLY